MEYEITEQRQHYLDARGKTILTACPGSGKTTSIVYKLGRLKNGCRAQYGRFRGIACLSFTNKACSEIEYKYKAMFGISIAYPDVVSTIDSFITEKIVMPYWHMFNGLETKPMVVNDKEVLRRLYLVKSGTSVLNVCGFRGVHANLLHRFDPSEINIGVNCFYYKNSILDNQYNEYADAVVRYRMMKGFCNSQDVAWIANSILLNKKNLATAIAQRFPYIIVDEAQDTSELQFSIFNELINNGLENMEYVGDVYQSIYEWRQASPQNFERMISYSGWNVLNLTENRRSVQHIIDTYSRIRKVGDPPIVSHNVENKQIPVVVYKYDNTNISSVINNFRQICEQNELKNYHVLTRGNDFIRQYNGATNQVEFWKSNIPYLLIKSLQYKESGQYPKAIKYLLHVRAELTLDTYAFKEKKEHVRNGYDNIPTKAKMMELLMNLPSLDESFVNWTIQAQTVLKEKLELQDDVNFNAYKSKKGYTMGILRNEPIAKYYREDDADSLPFTIETIHSSKGASYGGVLLVLSSNSQGQNLSLNSFKNEVPLTEKQRLLYVACSRAEQFLAFAVPANTSNETVKQRLGVDDTQIKSIELEQNLFFLL